MNKLEDYAAFRQRQSKPPLRTVTELATEFGISQKCLSNLMRFSTTQPPEPQLRHRGKTSATWYEPVAMRAWWKRELAAKPELIKRYDLKEPS